MENRRYQKLHGAFPVRYAPFPAQLTGFQRRERWACGLSTRVDASRRLEGKAIGNQIYSNIALVASQARSPGLLGWRAEGEDKRLSSDSNGNTTWETWG